MEKNYRAELVGVLGDPVDGNPTGVMEEAGFAHAGLNWRYLTIKVLPNELEAAMAGVKAFHMRGVNLTMPHKINVLKYLDELSEAARLIGAVNTVVVREDGTLFGENTDGKGFVQSLVDAGVSLKGAWVTILGAGGAARAIGVECALAGVRTISIYNRNAERGQSLADLISEHTPADAKYREWSGTAEIPEETDILINATCVGLHPDGDACPDIDFQTVTSRMVVCDVVFNPAETVFLKRAKARGARCVDGLGMLVNQGCINYTLWTGQPAPRDVMYRQLRQEFRPSPRRLEGRRYSETGVYGVDFYADGEEMVRVRSHVIPSLPVSVRGFGREWISRFDGEATLFPGMTRLIEDSGTGEVAHKLVYMDYGWFHFDDTLMVRCEEGRCIFYRNDETVGRIETIQKDGGKAVEVEVAGDAEDEDILLICAFPMLRFGG